MADSTEVVPDAVLAFGVATMDQFETFPTRAQDTLMPIVGAALGVSGMQEGMAAMAAYSAAQQALAAYVADVGMGLQSLGYAAATVAWNYRTGDAEQSAQMAGVDAAFDPPPGQPSLATQRAELEHAPPSPEAVAEARRLAQLARMTGEDLTPTTWLDVARGQGVTASSGSSNGYTRYRDVVDQHDADLQGEDGGSVDTSSEDYSPQAEYDRNVETAERLTEQNRIEYRVDVDEYGDSEVVQVDPDAIPSPDLPSEGWGFASNEPQTSETMPVGGTD